LLAVFAGPVSAKLLVREARRLSGDGLLPSLGVGSSISVLIATLGHAADTRA